jgi:tRNA(Ile)-lysidine synthase
LVAVSGGADSVALLRVMLELRSEMAITLSVLHLNHQLRGAESDADEQFVRDLAASHQLEFIAEAGDVKAYAKKRRLSVEAAARRLRYEFFERVIRANQCNKVATAHTLNDQAETVLLRLVRGTGFKGLGGIRPSLEIPDAGNRSCGQILRPFLSVRRQAVREYLRLIGQTWREDATNQDLQHTRNRVRQLLIPLLEKEFNPAVVERLSDLAEIAQGEEEFWAAECRELHSLMLKEPRNPADGQLAIDLQQFAKLSKGAQRRLIQSLEVFAPGLEFKHVDEIVSLSSGEQKTSQIVLPSGWKVVRSGHELRFSRSDRERESLPSEYEYRLPVPGSVVVAEAGVAIEAAISNGSREFTQLGDPKLLQAGLVVRNWRSGERFWPEHTKEPKKIKELLQDRHVTGAAKKVWPVVASGEEVIWVRGLGIRKDLCAKGPYGLLIRERPMPADRPS